MAFLRQQTFAAGADSLAFQSMFLNHLDRLSLQKNAGPRGFAASFSNFSKQASNSKYRKRHVKT
jgi:hypothetical protein